MLPPSFFSDSRGRLSLQWRKRTFINSTYPKSVAGFGTQPQVSRCLFASFSALEKEDIHLKPLTSGEVARFTVTERAKTTLAAAQNNHFGLFLSGTAVSHFFLYQKFNYAAAPCKNSPYSSLKALSSYPKRNKIFFAVLSASSVFLLSDLSE